MSLEYDSEKKFNKSPAEQVRRWLLEISLYDRTMKGWKTTVSETFRLYREGKQGKNSFNILWANTELLRQAVFQSAPSPNVAKRFKDEPTAVARAAGEVLQRALEFNLDQSCYFDDLKKVVLEFVLAGRGTARLRYVPSFSDVGLPGYEKEENEDQESDDDDHEEFEDDTTQTQELSFERVPIEFVDWEDFAHGPGKVWDEVQWIAFKHKMSREDLVDQFGEKKARGVALTASEDVTSSIDRSDSIVDLFSSVDVWEVWDRCSRQVIFVSEGYPTEPLKVVDDPLEIDTFFPMPPPIYDIECTTSLVPVVPYSQYKEQAQQLNSLHARIHAIIDAIRVRGAYDGQMTELANIFKSEDNQFVAADNAAAYMSRGGLSSAIWFMPIEPFAVVLQQLALESERCKQSIYEITGISDIMRAATNPNETATAQSLKSQWGSNRLARLQSTVQAYIKGIYELVAKIISKRFSVDTLQKMTGLSYPTRKEAKQMQLMQQQQAIQAYIQAMIQAQQAAQDGQQPPTPPPPQEIPVPLNWGDIQDFLQDDALRAFKIDVETDATASQRDQAEMAALKDLVMTISQTLQQLMPLVQQQILPMDAVKELLLSVVRRVRLGANVEDALDSMQAPPPPPPPPQPAPQEAVVPQGMSGDQQMQVAMAKLQQQAALEQQKLQVKAETDHAKIQTESQLKAQLAQLQMQLEAQIEQMKADLDAKVELIKMRTMAQSQERQAVLSTPITIGE